MRRVAQQAGPVREPLLTTTAGTILDGHARWQVAIDREQPTLHCIEYDVTDRGVAFQRAKDLEAAERCRCHKLAQAETGRCRYHGGTSKRGKDHHSYKHGFYSSRYHGILARAGEAQEAVEVALLQDCTLRDLSVAARHRRLLMGSMSGR